ncbi:hypothetical protein [Geomicrobium sp. JCM 19055]|nr:hypothetical protein [Geomicrobium sp. JCM 19055]
MQQLHVQPVVACISHAILLLLFFIWDEDVRGPITRKVVRVAA